MSNGGSMNNSRTDQRINAALIEDAEKRQMMKTAFSRQM
jgi:hypothetical protein